MTATAPPKPATKAQAVLMENITVLDDQIAASSKARSELVKKLMPLFNVGTSIVSEVGVFTKAQGSSTTVPFDKMVKARPAWMRRVSKTVLDSAKFTLLRKAGVVPDDLLALITTSPNAPYLVITRASQVEVTEPYGAATLRNAG